MNIRIGVQTGGGPSHGYFAPLHSALTDSFHQTITGTYFKTIESLELVFRVSGYLVDFESEGPERLRYMRKQKYISIDLAFPESSWKGQHPYEVHKLIIDGVEECLRLMIKRALKEKEVLDLEGLECDIKKAIDACREPASLDYERPLEAYLKLSKKP